MSDPFPQHIVPPPSADVQDVLNAHQLTFEFHQEVRYRDAFEAHCQRYQRIAAQHRQELAAMRNDISFYKLFRLWRH